MARRFFDIASAINAIAYHDDGAAFEYLFNAYYDKLYRVAYYYVAVNEQAEDAVSEVFYKLWLNRNRLTKIDNIESYLFSMVKNHCLSFLRSRKRIEYNESLLDFRQQIGVSDPESELISKEFISYISKYIGNLPPRCRIIFLMVKEDGMKYKEVAELLNISVKTVENQMTKAIGFIRKIVNKYQSEVQSIQRSE